jgi:hypothetical protein
MKPLNGKSGDLRGLAPFGAVVADYHGVAKREAVFEALWEFVRMVPFFKSHFSLTEANLWSLFLQTGIDAKRIMEELSVQSKTVYLGGGEDFEPEEEYYYTPQAGLLWENWRGLRFFIKDRAKLIGYLQSNRIKRFESFSADKQEYEGVVFDFTKNEVRLRDNVIVKIGIKSAKLARFILGNRGKKFTYEELADLLEESTVCADWRSSFNYKRSLDKLFERMNRKLGKKIFHFSNDSVFVEA